MDDVQFYVYVHFNRILIISGRWDGGTERLYAMEPHLRFTKIPPPAGLEPGTTL